MNRPWSPLSRACLLALACLATQVFAADAAEVATTADASTTATTSDAADPRGATPATLAADGWVPVAEDMLADARGGFDQGNGLLVSLSVDRVLSLNGDVVASGRLSTAEAGLSAFQVARVGEGSAVPGAAQPLAGLLLQNSANGQLIRSQTTIDATVNSLSILKDMHFGDSLRQSLSTAILPR
jgi:hypothetical protein